MYVGMRVYVCVRVIIHATVACAIGSVCVVCSVCGAFYVFVFLPPAVFSNTKVTPLVFERT